jgi:hypothetical protein
MRFDWGCLAAVPAVMAGCNFSGDSHVPPLLFEAGLYDGSVLEAPTSAPDASTADAKATAADAAFDGSTAAVDAALDASAPDVVQGDAAAEAGPPELTVLVTDATGPESDVPVVVQDVDGNVLASGATGADGVFMLASVTAGSQVTAVMGPLTAPVLVTVQGIEPGDVIPIADPTLPGGFSETVSIDSAPPNPPTGTTEYYAQIGSCFADAVPAQLDLSGAVPPCVSQGTFPIVVQALSNGSPVAYAFEKGNALAADDAGVTHLNVAGTWLTDTNYVQIPVSNWPSDGSIAGGSVGLEQVAGGVALPSFAPYGQLGPDGNPQVQLYTGYSDFLQTEGSLYVGTQQMSVTAIATRTSPDAGPGAVDLSQALPLLGGVVLDTSDPTRPAVTVRTADGGAPGGTGGAMVVLGWFGIVNDTSVAGSWTLFAPPTTTAVKVPALPTALAQWAPDVNSTVSDPPAAAFVDATFLTGYAQVRARVGALTLPSNVFTGSIFGNPILPPLPAEGTLRVTAVVPNAG